MFRVASSTRHSFPRSRRFGRRFGRAHIAAAMAGTALRPVFVLFGDSITQRGGAVGGWATRLAERYTRRADVVNRGYSGYNTAWATQLLPLVFPPGSQVPALVTVFLGANDAALPDHMARRQHVALEAYASNLRGIAAHVRRAYGGAATPPSLVFITPPPVDDDVRVREGAVRWGAEFDGLPERTNEVAGAYAAACRAVAAELGVPCVDAWTRMQALPAWRETLLNDGLHFAPAGDEALFTALTEVIDRELPHLTPERVPYDLPEWFDIDAADPVRLRVSELAHSGVR